MRPISIGSIAAILVASILSTPIDAAPPEVPTSIPYQGRLLDEFGQPRTGSVDLTVRIHDAVVGGTLVYRQDFPSVLLADGVFDVQLGPTGEATDSPADPLTTILAAALVGDAGPTAPLRFLELTVGSEAALARTQILASAYALRALNAASADTAASSNQVGGFSSDWIAQLLTHTLADRSEPPNTDPREGLADADGDGLANFVDPDNDNDALGDGIEVSQGSDINLTTPTLDGIAPTSGSDEAPTLVTVSGSNFQPGLTFSIGTQTPPVADQTATSFQASVDPQPVGSVDVTVTLANGESRTLADAFRFEPATLPPPILHSVPLGSYSARAAAYDLAVKPGTTEIALGGYKQYGVGDATTALTLRTLASRGVAGQIAVAYDANGRVSGLRCRDLAPGCAIEVLTDLDGDGELEDETGTAIETLNGTATLYSAQLARDPAGGWVAGYLRRTFAADVAVAHDRNGDGDFADASEIVVIESAGTTFSPTKSELAVDPAGRVAYAYFVAAGVRLAWDRNGDGDFADTVSGNPELVTLAGAEVNCFDLAFDSANHLAVSYQSGGPKLFRDTNDDGDFGDPGEEQLLDVTPGSCPSIAATSGAGLAVAFGTTLRIDRNGDGDFTDLAEQAALTSSIGNGGALESNGVDRVIAAGVGNLFVEITAP
jgi:hypothetical protein